MEAKVESLSRLARRNEEDASAMRSERNRLVIYLYIYKYVFIYVYVRIYIYTYMCMYVCMYVFIYRERGTR